MSPRVPPLTNLPRIKDDAEDISRWFWVQVLAPSPSGEHIPILHRFLGWDDSEPPEFLNHEEGRDYWIEAHEFEDLDGLLGTGEVQTDARRALERALECRRILPELRSWDGKASDLNCWGLNVPAVGYEFWPTDRDYQEARDAWGNLRPVDQEELIDAGLLPEEPGFLGMGMMHIPQLAPYLISHEDFVFPGGIDAWPEPRVLTTVYDGAVVLDHRLSPSLGGTIQTQRMGPKSGSIIPLRLSRLWSRGPKDLMPMNLATSTTLAGSFPKAMLNYRF